MGRLLGVGALALGLLVAAGPTTRPLGLAAAERQAKNLVGIIEEPGAGTTLSRLDEGLNAYGPRLRVGYADAWTISPQGTLAALSAHASESGGVQDDIRFVALGSLRLVPRPIALGGSGLTLLWTNPYRIVALVQDCCSNTVSLAVVDPGARRIVSRATMDGDVVAWTRAGDRLLLLVTPTNAIGQARLVVVDAVGGVQTVKLGRIVAGRSWPEDQTEPRLGTQRIPALAADAAGGRAYVIDPDGLAAEISLDSLSVSYHELAPASLAARLSGWLQPKAEAKGVNGTSWHGVSLANGFVAVTGTVEHAVVNAGSEQMTSAPAGLAIVDVRDWTIRTLDRGADDVAVSDGLLLATGRSWTSAQQGTPPGMGLAAYDSDSKLRFHLFEGGSAWVQQTWNGRAYVLVDGRTNVVDLANGRIVEQRAGTTPWLLLP
ncbi:MAG: hypothetical protein QOK13_1270 [Gaiellaceae bacterium]|nr:hypothetical protein [Gaiellaceae bacterium]